MSGRGRRLLFGALFPVVLLAGSVPDPSTMTVRFVYRGEKLNATFLTKVRTLEWGRRPQRFHEVARFSTIANQLDEQRIGNYLGDSSAEIALYRRGFFEWEPLRDHDDIVVLHREERLDPTKPVVGLLAVRRLSEQAPQLLVERRLRPLGFQVARPLIHQWVGNSLPRGVYPHWEASLSEEYFRPGNVLYGDVIQVNALFAKEGTWPLLHTLADRFGLFSTGRILLPGESIIQEGLRVDGPKVIIPTQMVWEVFNTEVSAGFEKSPRTVYYENSGATAYRFQGRTEWRDPHLGFPHSVQVLQKSGEDFRGGWTEYFARRESFSWVRDVQLISVERGDGSQPFVEPHLRRCVDELLAARSTPVVRTETPITVGISLGGGPQVQFRFSVLGADQQ